MNYTFTINIDILKILKFYLLGFIPAYLIVLYFEIDNLKTYLKTTNFTWKKMKKKYFLFFNKRVVQGGSYELVIGTVVYFCNNRKY